MIMIWEIANFYRLAEGLAGKRMHRHTEEESDGVKADRIVDQKQSAEHGLAITR